MNDVLDLVESHLSGLSVVYVPAGSPAAKRVFVLSLIARIREQADEIERLKADITEYANASTEALTELCGVGTTQANDPTDTSQSTGDHNDNGANPNTSGTPQ